MSDGFHIEPISIDGLLRIRREMCCDLEQAKLYARRDNLEAAIHRAVDKEDFKVCMLQMLSMIPKGAP